MRFQILFLFFLIAVLSKKTNHINVFRSYHLLNIQQPNAQKVAEILLIQQDKSNPSAELQLIFETLIQSSVFYNVNDSAVLYFKGADIQMKYTIRYEDVLRDNYKEIINLIVNQNGNVVGFNYFQQKLKKKQHKTSVVDIIRPEQGKEHVYTYTMAPPKSKEGEAQQQQQSFFSKYKWYIIGFGVVIYAMSNVDPQKAGDMARQAQGQRAA